MALLVLLFLPLVSDLSSDTFFYLPFYMVSVLPLRITLYSVAIIFYKKIRRVLVVFAILVILLQFIYICYFDIFGRTPNFEDIFLIKQFSEIEIDYGLIYKHRFFIPAVLLCVLSFINIKVSLNRKVVFTVVLLSVLYSSFSLYIYYNNRLPFLNRKVSLSADNPIGSIFNSQEEYFTVLRGGVEIGLIKKLFGEKKEIAVQPSLEEEYYKEKGEKIYTIDKWQMSSKLPDIFIIQVESLSSDFMLFKDILPFLYSLKMGEDNFYFKNIYNSIKGGGTSTSEFITLTGLQPDISTTSIYNKYGAIKYENTIPLFLKDTHKSYFITGSTPNFWNRQEGMKYMGFDSMVFSVDYDKKFKRYYGNIFDDRLIFNKALEYTKNQPIFEYIVTISTHAPFKNNINKKVEEKYFLFNKNTQKMLSKFNEVDSIIAEFISRLKKQNRFDNALIIIFGDHRIGDFYLKELRDTGNNSMTVPFFVKLPKGFVIKEELWNKHNFSKTDIFSGVMDVLNEYQNVFEKPKQRSFLRYYNYQCIPILHDNIYSIKFYNNNIVLNDEYCNYLVKKNTY
jgi:phosphoglycerol transferase MdoB-like AlkP superfamily enzyme